MGLSERLDWTRMPLWLRAVVMVSAYAVAAELGNALSIQSAFSTFWPPAGVALVLLALSPRKDWVALLAALILANVASDLLHERSLAVAAGFALANATECGVGAYLVQRFVGRPPRLTTRRSVLAFGVWAAAVAPALGATIGATVVALAFGGSWLVTWATWWSGDALGVLVVGTFGLVLAEQLDRILRRERILPAPRTVAAFAIVSALTVGLGVAVVGFAGPLSGLKFAVALPVAIAATVFGTFGTVSLSLALSLATTSALALKLGHVPLATDALSADILVLQAFLGVIAFASVFLAAAVDEARSTAAAERVLAEKYRVLLETLPIGVTISDDRGAILETSRQAREILGVTGEQQRERGIGGGEWRMLYPDGTDKPADEWVSVRALRDGALVRGQECAVRPDGSSVWLDVTAAPIPVEGYGVAITYADITDQVVVRERLRESEARLKNVAEHLEELVHDRTEALERTNRDLLEASAAKSRFLANMSHELRTPLNSVIGFSGVLEQGLAGPLNEEQAREVGMIRTAGQHLLALVSDILDLTRIEAGRAEIEVAQFMLSDLVSELTEMILPLALEKGLTFEPSCGSPDIRMRSDRLRLHQILSNLLTNALKFTDAGRIDLECRRDGSDVIFVVRDSGIGIPADEIPRIMEEFHQVDRPSDGMKPPGTGLGLPISSRLVALLGGTLSVVSVVGEGSEFTVRVPLELAGS
jgi:PAS domain S-box-containing protein